jgi:hypothetical protein
MADQLQQAIFHFADAAGAVAATAGETVAKEEKNGLFDLLVRGVRGSLTGLHSGFKAVGQAAFTSFSPFSVNLTLALEPQVFREKCDCFDKMCDKISPSFLTSVFP